MPPFLLASKAPTGATACSHGCQPVEFSRRTLKSPDRGDSDFHFGMAARDDRNMLDHRLAAAALVRRDEFL